MSIRYKLVCEQNVFCYLDLIFANIVRLIIQNRFHLPLKVLLHSKFIAKSTYRLLKRPQKNQVGLSLHDRLFMSQAGRTRYFARSATRARSARRGKEKNKDKKSILGKLSRALSIASSKLKAAIFVY